MISNTGVPAQSGGAAGLLFDMHTLKAASIPWNCFAKELLLKICTPPGGLLYIAPGIRVPSIQTFRQFQHYLLGPTYTMDIPSVMLFPADQITKISQPTEEGS
tara:strand:- start:378 stop:686 length:309 start_codon:yes stop_codon:yes gene_type:complete